MGARNVVVKASAAEGLAASALPALNPNPAEPQQARARQREGHIMLLRNLYCRLNPQNHVQFATDTRQPDEGARHGVL